jgi:hypothetical protein
MIKYQIPLKGIKVSTNSIYAGTNWKARKEIKDRVLDVAESFCQPAKRIKSYPVKIEYKFFFATRPLDSSNCSFLVKMFEDALCTLGILKDDAPQFVASTSIEVVVVPKEKDSSSVNAQGEKVDAKDKDLLEIIIIPKC